MHSIRRKARPVFIIMTFLMLLLSIPPQSAMSAIVDTESMLNISRGQEARDYLKQILAQYQIVAHTWSCLLLLA